MGIISGIMDSSQPLPGLLASLDRQDSGQSLKTTLQGSLLVVDDTQLNRDLLSHQLRQQGHTVSAAENGLQALEMLRSQPYDLVLLDIMMPEIDGYQVLQQIKSDATLRYIPVLMISAVDDLQSVVACIEMGAEDYLSKPFNKVLLKARINACLEKKRLRDQEQATQGELVKALEKERQLRELKSRFISMASHEFRTPLATILVCSDLIKCFSDKLTPEQKLDHLNKIQAEVQHMTRLLDDILCIGKTEAGRVVFNPAPLEVKEFCQKIVEEIQLTANKTHTLTFESEGNDATAEMDINLLRQILTNLLSNAVKYSPKGKTVSLNLSCEPQQFIFQVQDQGIGIPQADREYLFEAFHRASNVGNISGTGLGLSIVKNAVELHQGQISVESEVGVGTKFTICLPKFPLKDAAQ